MKSKEGCSRLLKMYEVCLSSCMCELSLSLFFRIDDIEDNSKLRRGIPGKSDRFSAGINEQAI